MSHDNFCMHQPFFVIHSVHVHTIPQTPVVFEVDVPKNKGVGGKNVRVPNFEKSNNSCGGIKLNRILTETSIQCSVFEISEFLVAVVQNGSKLL